jgi:tripartite-type tricarboxylate transporter receptor subunit TctC
MTALLAGNIDLGSTNLAAAGKNIQAGTMKVLGFSGPDRTFLKDVPTFKEQGVDLISGVERGIVLPKGASPAVIKHWETALLKACRDPKVQDQLTKKGTLAICESAADYASYLKTTFNKWKAIAKKVGVYKRKD